MKDEKDFQLWITSAENAHNSKKDEREKCREYYENVQSPDDIPAGITYVEENLITDLVNGQVGMMSGDDFDIELSGGGDKALPIIELVKDMLERNRFNERIKEPWCNFFYVEGKTFLEFYFNPRKKSIYGIGMPEIYARKAEETWLDPNSKGWLHEDDIFRVLPQRILLSYAKEKWSHKEKEIYESMGTRAQDTGNETHKWCDLYIVEYRETVFEEEDGIEVEKEVYYKAKVINKTVVVEEPKKTGYSRFTLIATIHTPRMQTSTEPFGTVLPVIQTQDIMNATGSAAYEVLKSDIKNLFVVLGGTDDEVAVAKRDLAKPNALVNFKSATNFQQVKSLGLSPAMLQLYEWRRKAFDEISGRYAPEKGASEQALSGRAIAFLQNRGITPELTKKAHLEYALSELGFLLIECAIKKMSEQPFAVDRVVDGRKRKLYYNYKKEDLGDVEIDEYNVLDEEGYINHLVGIDIDEIDLEIKIRMNAQEEEAFEANKAMNAFQAGLLPMKTTLKKLYPKRGEEYYEAKMNETQAMQVMKMMEENPEVGQMVMKGMQEMITIQEMQDKAKEQNAGTQGYAPV